MVVVGAGVVVVGAGVVVVGVLVVVVVAVVVGVLVVVAVVAVLVVGVLELETGHWRRVSASSVEAASETALLSDASTPDRLLAEFSNWLAAFTAAAH